MIRDTCQLNPEYIFLGDISQSTIFPEEIDFDLFDPTQTQSIDTLDTADTKLTLTTLSFQLGVSTTGSIWSGRTSSRHSWVWRHGERVVINGKSFWQCKLCTRNPQRYADGSTKHPITHLKLHRMTKDSPMPDIDPATSIIARSFGAATPRINFNIDLFKQILIQWIVDCH